jgi:hypothetical protein
MAQYICMEWRNARWVGYCLAALLWAALMGVSASALPNGAGGGTLVTMSIPASARIARPPAAAATERIHVYTGDSQAAQVFWEQPAAGRVHFTIELPDSQSGTKATEPDAPVSSGN